MLTNNITSTQVRDTLFKNSTEPDSIRDRILLDIGQKFWIKMFTTTRVYTG